MPSGICTAGLAACAAGAVGGAAGTTAGLVATGAATADPAGALAKADAMASAPWNEAAVAPIVAGFFHRPPAPEKIAEYRAIALQASQRAGVEAARSNARERTFEDLSRIAVPTLIVQGRHDRARTPEHGEAMRALIPNAALEVIEEAGHTPQLECPDEFHRIALPFLTAGSLHERP